MLSNLTRSLLGHIRANTYVEAHGVCEHNAQARAGGGYVAIRSSWWGGDSPIRAEGESAGRAPEFTQPRGDCMIRVPEHGVSVRMMHEAQAHLGVRHCGISV